MRIAQQVVREGMASGTAFMEAITNLIKKKKLKKIIETGSYMGTGTTKAIRDAMKGDEQVYSIEVNPEHHKMAVRNNDGSGINFLLGLSVARPELPVSVNFDNMPSHVIVDHHEKVREKNYKAEVDFKGEDALLDYALSKFDYKPDLVILDSAGHMGLVEFNYLIQRAKGTYYLALDDTLHVKHYLSLEYIKDHIEDYKIIFETDEKFGSAIVRVSIL